MKNAARSAVCAGAVFLAGIGELRADWPPEFQPGSYPYAFGPSALVPKWSEANVGEWTFNYEQALANAKAEGRYTLLLFAGLWWCPHCQSLENNVLATDAFKEYVNKEGYYLAALDFPYRDGHSMWTWLWDPAYREANGIGDWTPQQIAEEYIKRFEYQELMHTQGAATTTNNNVLVQISADGTTTNLAVYADNPTTVYRRVGYPTIIVIDPIGREVGRFSYNMKIDPAEGLDYVLGNIETIKASGRNALFQNPDAGGIEGASAQTYDAVLTDIDGVPAGIATFRTAKKSARAGTIKVTASVQTAGGRKISLKGTAGGAEGEYITLSKTGSSDSAQVTIGAEGVSGVYTDGENSYLVQGARNPFKARDAVATARAAGFQKGVWTYALGSADNSGDQLAAGYSSFSAVAGAKGKVKISGTLADGSSVAISSQAIIGEGGVALVPVIGKKGAFSMMLELKDGKLSAVTGVSGWKTAKRSGKWRQDAVFAEAGVGSVPETMYLQIGNFNYDAGINGNSIAVSPNDDAIQVKDRKWTGTKGVTDLKVTFSPKDGKFKGSFCVYVSKNGRTGKMRVAVSGVVIGGVPHGTAVIKNVVSWPVKFAGSCGGGC